MSIKLCFPTNCKKLEMDFFLSVGDPPEASKLESKNKFKSPTIIIFFDSSNKKSSSNLSSSQKVFICSGSVLALYRFIIRKAESSIVTSTIRILPLLSLLTLLTEIFLVGVNPIMTPQELVVPCEKYNSPLKSFFHLSRVFSEE